MVFKVKYIFRRGIIGVDIQCYAVSRNYSAADRRPTKHIRSSGTNDSRCWKIYKQKQSYTPQQNSLYPFKSNVSPLPLVLPNYVSSKYFNYCIL